MAGPRRQSGVQGGASSCFLRAWWRRLIAGSEASPQTRDSHPTSTNEFLTSNKLDGVNQLHAEFLPGLGRPGPAGSRANIGRAWLHAAAPTVALALSVRLECLDAAGLTSRRCRLRL